MSKDFLITYGSQTGQAESIADQIYAATIDLGLEPRLCRLDEVDKEFFIEKERLVVFVISSTGDGDPPENAHRFFRKIHRKTNPPDLLQALDFALLGLGDSNYSTFQGAPRKLDKQLESLGGTRILETGVADDQVGLELAVEPWCEKLYQVLAKRFHCDAANGNSKSNGSLPIKSVPVDSLITSLPSALATATMAEDSDNLLPHLLIEPVPFPDNVVSLIKGAEALQKDENLRVPVTPQAFIGSSVNHEKFDPAVIKWQNGDRFPGQHTEPIDARVVSVSEISPEGVARKPKREIVISVEGDSEQTQKFLKDCDAGDSVYFIFPNPAKEVDFILDRIGLLTIADQKLELAVAKDSQKRDAKIPAFIPNPCSLRYLFTYCLDIRRAPGRPLLRAFAECADDEKEKRRLLELCSAQGVSEFTSFIRQAAISVVDLLVAFPSCKPSVDRLIELLPRLIPRPYSVSNHQSRQGRRIRFVYSLLDFPVGNGIQFSRFGVCSAWMRQLHVGDKVQVILKEPSKFRLPPIASPSLPIWDVPLILVGPGTGVAPFASFFQKLLAEKIANPNTNSPKRYLFYGSSDLSIEYIMKDELESLHREGIITDLVLCESRPTTATTDRPKYVQDALRARGKEIVDLILSEQEPRALVFACGDAKGMSKDLFACFQELFTLHAGKSPAEAMTLLKTLKEQERYIEDVWS